MLNHGNRLGEQIKALGCHARWQRPHSQQHFGDKA
jgi:hypothetical protein